MPTKDFEKLIYGRWGNIPNTNIAETTNAVSKSRLDGLSATVTVIDELPLNSAITTKHIIEKCSFKIPQPEVIMQREKPDRTLADGTFKPGGLYTTVKWNDGTYTTVKASQDDEVEQSVYMAFCAALAKKLYGTNGAVHRMVERHTDSYIKAKKQKEKQEKLEKDKAAAQAAHERAVLREAKKLRLKNEAKEYNRAHSMNKED